MTDTSEQILPCPFCGGAPTIGFSPRHPADISCENCPVIVETDVGALGDAVKIWNTRASAPRQLGAEVVARVQKESDIAEARHGNVLLRLSDVKAMLRALDALQKIAAYERGGEISPGPTGDRDDMIGLAREALA